MAGYMESVSGTESLYSQKVGFVYVFNLIVGTGALTMPRAFARAGWLVSLIAITVLAFVSFVTMTFVIESMAAANAVLKRHGSNRSTTPNDEMNDDEECEDKPLLHYSRTSPTQSQQQDASFYGSDTAVSCDSQNPIIAKKLSMITNRVEMGKMASMFYPKKYMVVSFYVAMCVYLYGDLAIYAAAVPKSIRDVACTYSGYNRSAHINATNSPACNSNLTDDDICWPGVPSINRQNAYRIFLSAFILLLGPFIFFNVQKTKYLQMFTTVLRWLSFSMMIVLAVIQLSKGQGQGDPPVGEFGELPTLFGVCVYSFMCHHSLPSLVTPIREKSGLYRVLGADYLVILVFYSLLSFTAIFTFHSLRDLYTLNFFCDSNSSHPVTDVAFIQYFLALFPVFTLSTNFPIIGITLRNNLSTLAHLFKDPIPLEPILFPLFTMIPPVAIAFATSNVTILVGVTGSYAGAAIQYMIPVALVYYARKSYGLLFTDPKLNYHSSPFTHGVWLILVLVWFLLCIVLVTVNHIINKTIS